MLETARHRVLLAGAAEKVRLEQGDARSLPFDDGEFDALTFTYLLRYVEDPAATLRELARVVRPGGDDRRARVRRCRPASGGRLGALGARGLPGAGR